MLVAGMPFCDWCGHPATSTLVVAPALYETKQIVKEDPKGRKFRQAVQHLKTPERVADCCALHSDPELHDPKAAKRGRKKESKRWAEQQERLA